MDEYVNHIEKELSDVKDDKHIYEFKKQIYEKMNERANELTHTGLKDTKVLSDIVISEYSDIRKEYAEHLKKEREHLRSKRFIRNNILGSAIFILASLIIFLCVSFATGMWNKTWLIIEGGCTIWLIYELSLLIKSATKSSKKMFKPGARILLATNVMLTTQLVFLISLVVFGIPKSWLWFIFGVIVMYIADGIYVAYTKQRIRILNYLFYVVAASPMIYIILASLGILAWSNGWIIIPMSLLVDLIIVAIKLISRQSKLVYEEVE